MLAAPSLVHLDLVAAVTAVTGQRPRVLTLDDGAQLPSGALDPSERSLQSAMNRQVKHLTGLTVGHAEQLYTFVDRGQPIDQPGHISIGYMGLAREQPDRLHPAAGWQDWYDYFPWEDCRKGTPLQHEGFIQHLQVWAATEPALHDLRLERLAVAFGLGGVAWSEELILQRYELLYEAGLVPESPWHAGDADAAITGLAMRYDHRRVLATGIARIRAKVKYRPVVFELLPEAFTLLQLQQTVEALAGRLLHKPNFRRLIAQQDLIEETDEWVVPPRGRPARLHRFRPQVLAERAAAGSSLPRTR